MKITIQMLILVLLMTACQQPSKYTQQSPEIEAAKALLQASASGDFEAQRKFYAENAQIFYNVTEDKPSTIDEMIEQQQSEGDQFSNVKITVEEDAIEMVTTDKGET